MVQKKLGNYLHRWIRRSLKYNWLRYEGPPHYNSLKISTPACYPTPSKELRRESVEFVGGGVGGRRGSVQEGRWGHPWQLTVPASSMAGILEVLQSQHLASLSSWRRLKCFTSQRFHILDTAAETHNLTSLWEKQVLWKISIQDLCL